MKTVTFEGYCTIIVDNLQQKQKTKRSWVRSHLLNQHFQIIHASYPRKRKSTFSNLDLHFENKNYNTANSMMLRNLKLKTRKKVMLCIKQRINN